MVTWTPGCFCGCQWTQSNLYVRLTLGIISSGIFHPWFTFDWSFVLLSSKLHEIDHYNFYTCHDSRAVVACAKICSELMIRNWIKVECYQLSQAVFWCKIFSAIDLLGIYLLYRGVIVSFHGESYNYWGWLECQMGRSESLNAGYQSVNRRE